MSRPQLNMKIAMRSPRRHKITTDSINSIPTINTFVEPDINSSITAGCKEVLSKSLYSKTHQHGECALLISTLKYDIKGNKLDDVHEIAYGDHRKVSLTDRMISICTIEILRI